MENQFLRTEILLGSDAMKKLKSSKVAIFGVGGVGGYVAEALARCGVGAFELIDRDQVSVTNLNRQIIATWKTIGMDKTEAMADRIHDINPEALVVQRKCFYLPETADQFDFTQYDYVVDAVDTVTAKIEIILQAQRGHSHCQNRDHPAGSARRHARDQQHGSGQQDGPFQIRGGGHLQDVGGSPCAGNAQGTEKAGRQETQSGILQRRADEAAYQDRGGPRSGPQRCARKQRFHAVGSGASHRVGSGEGPDQITHFAAQADDSSP